MKQSFVLLVLCFYTLSALSQKIETVLPDPAKKLQTVEVSCGKCQFGLQGKTCELAVRIKAKAYYVDGTDIDSYGDAHASHGFCNAVRKAEVQGEIINDRFKLSYFKLIPVTINKTGKAKAKNKTSASQ